MVQHVAPTQLYHLRDQSDILEDAIFYLPATSKMPDWVPSNSSSDDHIV